MPAPAKRTSAHRAAKSRPPSRLGSLPEWNLSDLYAGIDDPQVKRDLDRGAAKSLAFEQAYKGKLAMLADGPEAGAALAEAVKRYEALDDLLGRLTSYAGLLHAGDTVDPARARRDLLHRGLQAANKMGDLVYAACEASRVPADAREHCSRAATPRPSRNPNHLTEGHRPCIPWTSKLCLLPVSNPTLATRAPIPESKFARSPKAFSGSGSPVPSSSAMTTKSLPGMVESRPPSCWAMRRFRRCVSRISTRPSAELMSSPTTSSRSMRGGTASCWPSSCKGSSMWISTWS